MTKLTPHRIIHPKEIFERELEARGETVETLADKTGIFWGIWEQVLTGARIDNDLAIALEKAWGTSAQTWLNLWENYMERIGDRPQSLACPDCDRSMVPIHDGDHWVWNCHCLP